MSMKFRITNSENDLYILTWKEDEHVRNYVGEGGTPHQSYANVLYKLASLYGPSDSRHDPERIYIEVRPGDKWIDANPLEDEAESLETEAEPLYMTSTSTISVIAGNV